MKKILILAFSLGWILAAQFSWAGELVFGPRRFTPPNEAVSFLVTNPVGPFWLQVRNGEAVPIVGAEPGVVDMQNLVTGGTIVLNGSLVATASDFDHNTTLQFGFQKDVTLTSVNTLEVQLQGPAGSFITVEIIVAEPNVTVSNGEVDLSGRNAGDSIDLWWEPDESAAEYVVFRSNSAQGPWQELFRRPQTRPQGVDFTADATLMDLCYKVDVVDVAGVVIRSYEPICVPKFVETNTQSFAPTDGSSIKAATASFPAAYLQELGELASFSPLKASTSPPVFLNNASGVTTGSFPVVQADEFKLNPQVSNEKVDLSGRNAGDSIDLWWGPDERATEYIVFRADSMKGPWRELFRRPGHRGNGVDHTPDATRRDLCYRLEARDAVGQVVHNYEPICVPKFAGPSL